MTLLDGKATSIAIQEELKIAVTERMNTGGSRPHLAAIIVGDNPASRAYVGHKIKACERVGFDSSLIELPDNIREDELIHEVQTLNDDQSVDGFIVQLPLPKHIDDQVVLQAIHPDKDVDGFHPIHAGRLSLGLPSFLPATPAGIMELLERYGIETSGKHCVVIGRSNIVGSPMSILMAKNSKYANCTVTLTHSRTKNLEEFTKAADIVIVALGKPAFLTGEMIKEGAIVIDVGITRVPDDSKKSGFRIQGDADFTSCAEKASYITPVPGGVGLMTVASLMKNTLAAAKKEIYG